MSLRPENIDLDGGEYLSFCGIVSVDRTFLFESNKDLTYILELTSNINYIAISILTGNLEKILLNLGFGELEKCLFLERNDIFYIICGNFPDKKGKWVLEQMAKYFSDLVRGKDVNNLSKLDKYEIEKKFKGHLLFIFKEYMQLEDVFSDQKIPDVEDWLRLDYAGLSCKSIGLISILFDENKELNVKVPGEFEDPAEEVEMKESLLTAKIEAIAADTIFNTGAYPRSIVVKLGFQKYRFITFRECENDYLLVCISEGNSEKIGEIEDILEYLLEPVTKVLFRGNLRPFRKMKGTIRNLINNNSKDGVLNFNSSKMVELKQLIANRAQTGQK